MRALALSRAACALLDGAGECRVHSVYRSTVNLLAGEGRLVCLTGSEVPLHPYSLRLPVAAEALPELRRGDVCPVRERAILLPGGVGIDYSHSPLAELSAAALTGVPVEPVALGRFRLVCEPALEKSALGFLLRPALDSPLRPMEGGIRAFLRAAVDGSPQAAELARGLIGLGWGLTPTLDDFCVGILAALWRTGRGAEAGNLGRALAAMASERSTAISAEFLHYAARGLFGEPVLSVLRGLSDRDGADVQASAAALLKMGHSSGTDTAVGLLMGLNSK